MNTKGKVKLTGVAIIPAILILLAVFVFASLSNNQIPDQILPVNSSTELNLSAYFPEFSDNVWFSVS